MKTILFRVEVRDFNADDEVTELVGPGDRIWCLEAKGPSDLDWRDVTKDCLTRLHADLAWELVKFDDPEVET